MYVLNGSSSGGRSWVCPIRLWGDCDPDSDNVIPGQTYYILGQSAQPGPGQNGAFGLLVNFGTSPQAPIAPSYTTVAQQPDQGVNGWGPEMTLTPKQMRQLQRRFRDSQS